MRNSATVIQCACFACADDRNKKGLFKAELKAERKKKEVATGHKWSAKPPPDSFELLRLALGARAHIRKPEGNYGEFLLCSEYPS